MMKRLPRTTIDQWAVLAAVVDERGFAAAGEALSRSQSAVSYAIRQLETQLPIALLDHSGRRAELTPAGQTLLRRARAAIEELQRVEALATSLAAGWEGELRIAVDLVFPPTLLQAALARFGPRSQGTRVEVYESVLSGTTEALLRREVDLAIVGQLPPGFLGAYLMTAEFVAVAHPAHALHALGRPLTVEDLRRARQIVVRDSGSKRRVDAGWLGAEQRWTVSHITTSIELLKSGLGFAWIPSAHIQGELDDGRLVPLPLVEGGTRRVDLQLVHTDPDSAGPATREFAGILSALCAAA